MWVAFVHVTAKASLIFSTKNISVHVFGYEFLKHLTSWLLNKLVKLTMHLNNQAQIITDTGLTQWMIMIQVPYFLRYKTDFFPSKTIPKI